MKTTKKTLLNYTTYSLYDIHDDASKTTIKYYTFYLRCCNFKTIESNRAGQATYFIWQLLFVTYIGYSTVWGWGGEVSCMGHVNMINSKEEVATNSYYIK
jgi:hypothetical protein